MRHLMAFTFSGLLGVTALTGCLESSSSERAQLSSPRMTQKNWGEQSNQMPNRQYSLAESCYYDLCKASLKTVPNIIQTIRNSANASPAQEKYYRTYIEPALKELVQENERSKIELQNLLVLKEPQFPNVVLEEAQLRFIRFYQSILNLENDSEFKIYFEYVYAKEPYAAAFGTFSKMGGSTYFQKMYPRTDLAAALKQEHTIIKGLSDKTKSVIGITISDFDPEVATKIINGKMLTTAEVESFTTTSHSQRMIHHFLFGKGMKLIDSLNQKNPLSKQELFELYSKRDLKKKIQELLGQSGIYESQCRASFMSSINLYPHGAQIEKFKPLAEKVRQAAIRQLQPSDPAVEKLQTLKFIFPKTADENMKSFLRKIKNNIAKSRFTSEEMKTMTDSAFYTLAFLLAERGIPKDTTCDDLPNGEISDKTIPYDGYVNVSWFSLRYPQMGVGILAHEMGHSVYAYSNSLKYTRQCLVEKQDGQETFANEDFSDIFGAKVAQTMESEQKIPALNFACGLIVDPSTVTLQNSSDDPHSSGLYRALQIHTTLGKPVSLSCQSFAAQTNPRSLGLCQ